ncbi:hypothetical protein AAKU55_005614 [Oxalobacteraceae bacterium GrIS 1.11]
MALRQEQAKPLLALCQQWLVATRLTVADGSGTAKAIDHALKRWPALVRYADSGTLPIDNNPVHAASGKPGYADSRIMPRPRCVLIHLWESTDSAAGFVGIIKAS